MATNTDYMTQGISIEESFPYGTPMQKKKLVVAPSGICDPTMSDTRERLAPFRVSTAFFTGTMAAPGADIVFPATSVLLFTTGPQDDAAPTGGGVGGLLARSDTNAQQQSNGGGAVRAQQAFVATGMWFQWETPYTVPAGEPSVASLANIRKFSSFLRSPSSPYDKTCLSSLSSVLNPQLKNGKQSACDFDLLSTDIWAQASGVAPQPIGFGGVGSSFLFLAVPDVSGGQGSGYELQIQMVQDRNISIESDAANATPGAAVKVVCALRCVMVGYPICSTPSVGVDYDALAMALVRQGGVPTGNYDPAALDAAMSRAKAGRLY